jgi:multiple sugar transport system permease protein
MVVSLSLAMAIHTAPKGRSAWQTIFYLPTVVPFVATFMIWLWLFNAKNGLINQGLEGIGIPAPNWLGSRTWAKPSLILMGFWTVGGQMLIWLAGLVAIDKQFQEAASIDGAGARQRFFFITLPLLSPYVFFNLVVGLIGVFQMFENAFIMTHGGPANETLFYVFHLFNNAFRFGKMGYACALAWILFVVIFTLTYIQWKLSNRWVHYETG